MYACSSIYEDDAYYLHHTTILSHVQPSYFPPSGYTSLIYIYIYIYANVPYMPVVGPVNGDASHLHHTNIFSHADLPYYPPLATQVSYIYIYIYMNNNKTQRK